MEFIINSRKYGKKIVLIDDEDYDKIKDFRWRVNLDKRSGVFYVRTGRIKVICLHRYLLNCPKNMVVDHKNHNGLDNKKINLRICTNAENSKNKEKYKRGATSKYKGVHWGKDRNKWRASIKSDNRVIMIGQFDDEKKAAEAYNEAAIKYHGEFANLNKII